MPEAPDDATSQLDLPSEADVKVFNITNLIGLVSGGLLMVLINVAVTLVVLDQTGNLNRPEIVAVDAADLIRSFVAAQDVSLPEEELQARVRVLNANFDLLAATYASERGLLIVNSAAILGGARDVTSELLQSTGLLP